MSKVFGIDLGTTYSCVASVDDYGRPVVHFNADSQPTTPSVVLFDSATDVVVGVQAKRNARVRPEEAVSLVKRHMGDAEWRFRAFGQDYSAPAISSQILKALARDAEVASGEPVEQVVVTVPAYFGQSEREATKLAAELAGLTVVDIINEPTAAAFTYGFGSDGANETVLVYDLGGGTFDTTVIGLADRRIDVVATDGDHELGGADWDERLAAHLSEQFVASSPAAGDPLDDSYGAQDLMTSAEETKQSLTTRESVDTFVVFNGGRASITLTRAEFEQITSTLLERTIDLTRKVLAAAAAKGAASIDRVLLVGGMAKAPAVARRLSEEFGFSSQLADPDLAVAKGAALYGQKKGLENLVLDSLRASGKLAPGQEIGQASKVDLEKAVRETAADSGLSSTAVAESVATEISNVTSRGFGVLTLDGRGADEAEMVAEFLAHANDTLPLAVEQRFFTMVDDQSQVKVEVIEQATASESTRPDDNKVIVEGEITGIPRGWSARTPVDVTFTMGADQLIEVAARHPGVPEALVLRVTAGMSSAGMREEERQKVQLLKTRG